TQARPSVADRSPRVLQLLDVSEHPADRVLLELPRGSVAVRVEEETVGRRLEHYRGPKLLRDGDRLVDRLRIVLADRARELDGHADALSSLRPRNGAVEAAAPAERVVALPRPVKTDRHACELPDRLDLPGHEDPVAVHRDPDAAPHEPF